MHKYNHNNNNYYYYYKQGKGTTWMEDPDLDGRIILKWILGMWGQGLDRAGSE
jgi:hypothetical protein